MTPRFAVGEQVIIRYGRHEGQRARIIENQTADTYRVKVEGGFVLFYSGKGLERENGGVQQVI
jgi:hypothetical protein